MSFLLGQYHTLFFSWYSNASITCPTARLTETNKLYTYEYIYFSIFGHSDTREEARGMLHRFSLKIMSGVADIRLHFLVDCVSCWQKLGNKQDKYQLKKNKKTFRLRRRSAENNEIKLIVKQEMPTKRSRRGMSD